ncbi:MAG: hypothetical protein QME76_08375 [Bacillota bacterium]|nr:hypothetical protein [Bacillota bacterium]
MKMRWRLLTLQEAIWWLVGGIAYTWILAFLFLFYEPSREWLFHHSPIRGHVKTIGWVMIPLVWGNRLTVSVADSIGLNLSPTSIGLNLIVGTLSGAAFGYVVGTVVRAFRPQRSHQQKRDSE